MDALAALHDGLENRCLFGSGWEVDTVAGFEFCGEVPATINVTFAGHAYVVPPDDVCLSLVDGLFDRASAVLAYAPANLKEDFEQALWRLIRLGIPQLMSRSEAISFLEHKYQECASPDREYGKPSFRQLKIKAGLRAWSLREEAWRKLSNYRLVEDLRMGSHVVAFGFFDRSKRPHYIRPPDWEYLRPSPKERAKFLGNGLEYWHVRVVSLKQAIEAQLDTESMPTRYILEASKLNKVSQSVINDRVEAMYQAEYDAGRPLPKRDPTISGANKIGATAEQVREALRHLPQHLKRGVGRKE